MRRANNFINLNIYQGNNDAYGSSQHLFFSFLSFHSNIP